ncbi:hypothetical protein [Methylobacterium sp. Leaf85]|uniref:hypothetical protein n=1 Tax=Methylobacterium sp. Leaf85 TaxID=1736241 RepID=UPI002377F478|nr:hypothetical protein [Methylobacterium sp. Leaf85]
MSGKARCRMHGGARGSGAPRGERNGRYRHGMETAEARAQERECRDLMRRSRAFIADIPVG